MCQATNSPKTTCLPSSQEVTTVVMKNCEPFVFGPALAIERRKGFSCLSWKFSSAGGSQYDGTKQSKLMKGGV